MPKKYKEEKPRAKDLVDLILDVFTKHPKRRFDPQQLGDQLGVKNTLNSLESAVEKLMSQNRIVRVASGKYALNEAFSPANTPTKADEFLVVGQVDMTRFGSAYIKVEGLAKDIFVSQNRIGNALDRDTVRVKYYLSNKGTPEGEIVEVVERYADVFVGTLRLNKQFGFIMTDKVNMATDIFVNLNHLLGAKDGERVVVKVTEWHDGKRRKSPVGVITAVLGADGSSDAEMKAILMKNGFSWEFPADVEKENEAIDITIDEKEIKHRRDFRKVTTFTIDPLTAKDFDDALSFQILANGNYEIGVHIADVTHYLKPGTALDQEAYRRSTSVYLVDRVAPMLPEKLSNGVCSLRPNEDKYTFSAVFEFTPEGKIVSEWFGKTAIHSNRRFTYEEAQEVLETGKGDYAEELLILNRLAKQMRKERSKDGAIEFEAPEVVFTLDETGKPIDVKVKERKDAHLLIEDFMLLANRQVSGRIFNLRKQGVAEIPFIYRVHDTPNLDKLADLAKFVAAFGYKFEVSGDDKKLAKSLNKLMASAQGKPEADIFNQIAIRAMAKAVYTTDNIGHYGLGYEHYSHFTSPIRRYADVLAHRILERNLKANDYRFDKNKLEDMCKHISAQERKATECERESVKYKQVEFMLDCVGNEYEGLVSGIAEHAIFIEIRENYCEGRVTYEKLPEPFDIAANIATGKYSGKTLKTGDVVRVKILDANLAKRQIDMELLGWEVPAGARERAMKGQKKEKSFKASKFSDKSSRGSKGGGRKRGK